MIKSIVAKVKFSLEESKGNVLADLKGQRIQHDLLAKVMGNRNKAAELAKYGF